MDSSQALVLLAARVAAELGDGVPFLSVEGVGVFVLDPNAPEVHAERDGLEKRRPGGHSLKAGVIEADVVGKTAGNVELAIPNRFTSWKLRDSTFGSGNRR